MRYSLFLLLIALFAAYQTAQEKKPLTQAELVKKGEYLVMVAGFHDCHTPKKMTEHGPEPDMLLMLSGHPQDAELPEIDPSQLGPGKWMLMNEHLTTAVGPWGISFSANLTPDEQTGIGLWREELFIEAMRTGKQHGHGPTNTAADALAEFEECQRRGFESDVCLSEINRTD